MKHKAAPITAVLTLSTLAACGGASQETVGSDDTTAQLLAQPVSDGNSTPVPMQSGAAPEGPPVQVATLGFNRGDPSAIVKVVEMSDFGCGYCRRFHDETFPTLREQFIESGMVEWKFIPYITGMFANSMAATEGSECVMAQSTDEYERIVTRMWTEQSAWKGSSEPEAVVRGWVDELDVDMDEYDACLADDRRVSRIASATQLARQLGVRGTPTFVIIGYGPLQGALPLEMFQEVFTVVHNNEMELREQAAQEGAGGDTVGPAADSSATEGAGGP